MSCGCCEATDCLNPVNQCKPCYPVGCSDLSCQICKTRNDCCGCCSCGLPSGGDASCCAPLGCMDLGCGSGLCCPAKYKPKKKIISEPPPCCGCHCNPRATHINRGPYCCPCRPRPDPCVYRCCEGVSSSYAGHIPGFTFHSLGRNWNKSTFGTKKYMDCCFYYNTWSKI